ncbi:MAG: hypothetical protein FJ088_12200 [Deltaproteobacteria bacterium]|nr:hypothetical protein [Deltaproteobacteria bacterium]
MATRSTIIGLATPSRQREGNAKKSSGLHRKNFCVLLMLALFGIYFFETNTHILHNLQSKHDRQTCAVCFSQASAEIGDEFEISFSKTESPAFYNQGLQIPFIIPVTINSRAPPFHS